MMPSCSRPYSSERSSCLMFVSFAKRGQNVCRADHPVTPRLRLPVKRQPRLLDARPAELGVRRPLGLAHATLSAPALTSDLRAIFPSNRPPMLGGQHRSPSVRRTAATPLSSAAGDRPGDDTCNTYCSDTKPLRVQPRFERAGHPRAIIDRHRRTVAPIDAHFEHRPDSSSRLAAARRDRSRSHQAQQ